MKPDFSPIPLAKLHKILLIATTFDKKLLKKCDFSKKLSCKGVVTVILCKFVVKIRDQLSIVFI